MEGARKVVNLSHSFQRFTSRHFHRSAVKRWRLCGCCMQLPRESLDLRFENYDKVFRRSIEHPQDYWAEQAEHIVWDKKWTKVLDNSKPPFTRWYASQFKFWCFLKLSTLAIRTTVVPITPLIGTTVVRISGVIHTTGKSISKC